MGKIYGAPPVQARQYTIPSTTLLQRLEWCQKDEAEFFGELDIGEFPDRVPAHCKPLPELDDKGSFRFVRWLYRSNGSDLALVEVPNHPLSVLKIHKRAGLFKAEKAAYAHLRSFNVQSCVLHCYGWKKITPKAFVSAKEPTCFGPEDTFTTGLREDGNTSRLPKRLPPDRAPPMSYNWNDERDKRMLELDVDFRPPSVEKSWNWVLNDDQSGSDAYSSSSEDGLAYSRCGLLLEYLPGAHRFQSHRFTHELACTALDGLQQIQKALVEHRDHTEMISRNLLITKGRVVFVDFDRAEVYSTVGPDELYFFKKDMLQFHQIVFKYMLRDKELGRESRFD